MQQRATVMLVTRDPALFREAAITLNAADYKIVSGNSISRLVPDLILTHWVEAGSQPPMSVVPVLTLDLSLVSGDDLVKVVERGLGRRAALSALLLGSAGSRHSWRSHH
jgi:hypothetical protein